MTERANSQSDSGSCSGSHNNNFAKTAVVLRHDSVSTLRQTIVQNCCSEIESVLLACDVFQNSEDNDHTSDQHKSNWTTLKPEFLQTSPFQNPIFSASIRTESNYTNDPIVDEDTDECKIMIVDWASVPISLHPSSGQLNPERAKNKEKQVEALLRYAMPMVNVLYERRKMITLSCSHHSDVNHDDSSSAVVHVVEFGAGSGHLGLLLAHLQGPKKCRVTLVERKAYACQQAQSRADQASLTNVTVVQASLHEWWHSNRTCHSTDQENPSAMFSDDTMPPTFDLGIALHACGVLTDAALTACLQQRAAFLMCPCCYGQVAANLPSDYLPRCHALAKLRGRDVPTLAMSEQSRRLGSDKEESVDVKSPTKTPSFPTYPGTTSKERRRLRKLQRQQKPDSCKLFDTVARSADCTSAVNAEVSSSSPSSNISFVETANFVLAKRCMQIVDADRLLWAQQHRYSYIRMASLTPLDVTPKNNVIVGLPDEIQYDPMNKTGPQQVDFVAVLASANENSQAEAGEKQKTGCDQFGSC